MFIIHCKKLNEAIFTAYGWKSDMADDEMLEKLLELNLESAYRDQ